MPTKNKGEGSNSMEWELSKRAKEIKIANIEIVGSIHKFLKSNYNKSVYVGMLGSGDNYIKVNEGIGAINIKS